MEIKIKYLRDIPKIKNRLKNGDWIDLYTGVDVLIEPQEYQLIPLGVAMELPKGYEAIIAPRSSMFRKFGLIQTNSIGIVDESYKGDNDEWCLPVISIFRIPIIPRGTRICQFRILEHQPAIEFIEVENLKNENRGGFGSTGYGCINGCLDNESIEKVKQELKNNTETPVICSNDAFVHRDDSIVKEYCGNIINDLMKNDKK